ncbi:MAG: endolytic transglycosylase MltG [Flavisolibacter sp.]
MKKIILILFFIILFAAGVAAWIVMGPGTGFNQGKKALYISSKAATRKAILDSLEKNNIVSNVNAFDFLATRMNYWDKIRPGKYEFEKGSSLLNMVRMLRNGKQTPVNLTITKIRTREDLARMVGRIFETDSSEMMEFFGNDDSMSRYNATTETALWNVLPDTYTYFWNSEPATIYKKLFRESETFWNDERKLKATQLSLTPIEVHTLASIIEEETTNHSEKDTIASVYLNRLRIGMPLQADPTLKFAAKDFALKRIAGEILKVESPYNTYVNKGLPPGPICTPSKTTIDKVLTPASTPYLYFVAKPGLGGHLFSASYEEHLRKRDDYLAADKKRREQQQNSNN